MAEHWRIAESRDQALISVVLRAARELLPSIDVPEVPEPLHPPLMDLIEGFAPRLANHVYNGQDYTYILREIDAVFSEGSELPPRITASPPWKTADVLLLWVSTARVLTLWRQAILAATREPTAPAEPNSATATSKWLSWGRSSNVAKKQGDGTPSPAVEHRAAFSRVKSLFEALAKQPPLVAGFTMVPLVCVKYAHVFRLECGSAQPAGKVSDASALSKDVCIRALVEWCGDLTRSGPDDDVPPATSEQFAQAVTALTNRECIIHPDPGKVPINQWHNGNGLIRRPPAGQLFALPRLPIIDKANNAFVAKGWATTPSPEDLAHTISRAAEGEPAFPSLRNAAQKAAAAWRDGRKKSLADGWPCEGASWTTGLIDGSTTASILELVRLGTLFFSGQSELTSINAHHLRFVLKLDAGVEITIDQLPQHSPTVAGRLIPYTHGSERASRSRRDFVAFKRQPWLTCEVGTLGPDARDAPAAVLAAVEDLDWLLWFLDTVRSHSFVDKKFSDLIARVLNRARYESWEPVKRRWMAAPASTAALEALQDHVYRARVGLMSSASVGHLGNAGKSLCSDVIRCEQTVLAALQTVHPIAFDNVFPPRCLDATYDIDLWISSERCGDPRGRAFRVRWMPSGKPFGDCIRERNGDDNGEVIEITLSSGQTVEQDHCFLNAPFFIACPTPPTGTYFAPLHDFAQRIWQDSKGGTRADINSAMECLQRHLLSTEGDIAFHTLVNSARHGDRDAIEWLDILQKDPRFRFECHPPIDCDGSQVTVLPAAADASLSWQDNDLVPKGCDVDIFFSMNPSRARRVLSRGRPSADSADSLAQSINDLLRNGPEELQALGAQLLDATDRWIAFPSEAPHPLATPLLGRFVKTLPRPWNDGHDLQAQVASILARWVASLGHRLYPSTWHPLDGAAATESPTTTVVQYHPTVPAGNVVVESFGLDGEHAAAWAGHLSAGPAPAGFAVLVEGSRGLSDEVQLAREVRTCLADLPRHYLAGKAPLVGPALFNAVWDLVLGAPEDVRASQTMFTDAVADLLKSSCGMTLFEPTGMGEYPSGWVRAPDGKSPRGDWITRVVRPGVRTAKNTLVWPAVVETE